MSQPLPNKVKKILFFFHFYILAIQTARSAIVPALRQETEGSLPAARAGPVQGPNLSAINSYKTPIPPRCEL